MTELNNDEVQQLRERLEIEKIRSNYQGVFDAQNQFDVMHHCINPMSSSPAPDYQACQWPPEPRPSEG